MENTLSDIRQWLINDQHEYGEFGKHEIVNPTDLPRTYEMSLIKPNIFSSIVAYSSLCATGSIPHTVQASFHEWLEKIRSEAGYWTSASGRIIPACSTAGWSRNNNLRHTAKCLDYYLLSGTFCYQDAIIFNDIIACQLEDGSFPQFKGMGSDLWSTAYFINLLIRAAMDLNLRATLPRGSKASSWKNLLANKLNRAVDWLLHKLESDSMWHISGADSVSITLAMMVEVGGYLALHNPEVCATVIRALIELQQTSPSFVYAACLALDTLNPSEQAVIIKLYENTVQTQNITPVDLIEATSLCKLHFINKDFGILLYYRDLSNGHESQMISLNEWNHSEYFCWALNSIYNGRLKENRVPLREADFWQYINNSINSIKYIIENARGWQLLWNDETPVNEEKVQIYLNGHLKTICEKDNVSVNRELETGHGPVDFSFSNSYVSKCMLEVKLSTNAALKNGNFIAQIYEYAKGLNVSSAFLVVVGFDNKLQAVVNSVNEAVSSFRKTHSDFYIQLVYIDAAKKISASKVTLGDIDGAVGK